MEQIDGVKIMHGRNFREYKEPELPHFIVDGYCPETHNVYEFFGCQVHGHTCQPYRDFVNLNDDTLAERYERKLSRV